MKKKLTVWLLAMAMCALTACSSETETPPKEDSKTTETETTNGDIVGDDAESQMTTSEADKNSVDKESDTGNTGETSTDEKKADSEQDSGETTDKKQEGSTTVKPSGNGGKDNSSEVATSKKTATGTTQKETTVKPEETTTKPAETTTKPAETTAKPTTAMQTTATPTTTVVSGYNDNVKIELDIKPSATAETTATNIVNSITNSSMNQFTKVKTIHDWIVKNVDYDYDGLKSNNLPDFVYTAEGALCNRLAVCQGYAEAFELLCAKAGIQAYMIYGKAGSDADGWQSHAWNVVKIDGEWYQIDCTWDDPLMNDGVITDGSNITYQYFLLTDNEMYWDHVVDNGYTKNLKVCTSTLYKGYAEKMSIEAAMEGSSNSSIVSTAEELKTVVKNYVKSNILTFSVAIPQSVGNVDNIIMSVLKETLLEKGVAFSKYGIAGGKVREVFNYTVYIDMVLYYQ